MRLRLVGDDLTATTRQYGSDRAAPRADIDDSIVFADVTVADKLGDKRRITQEMLGMARDETFHITKYNSSRDIAWSSAYNSDMKKSTSAFTIVELVIVIAVIGIRAAITLVAYNDAVNWARDAQTITAVNQWAKGLSIYKARNGSFPTITGCLGSGYKYGVNETASSGFQCRQKSATEGINDNPAFDALLAPYMSSQPSPAMQTAADDPNGWYRGAYFSPDYKLPDGSTSIRIDYVISPTGNCPPSNGGYSTVYTDTKANKYKICCAELQKIPKQPT